jgi:hypothetical protein
MANGCVYLHEVIDIVGTGSEAYKAHTGARGLHRTDGGAPLVGTWQQSGSTGRWPAVVNLWEMAGWDHWAEILARQYTPASAQSPELARWWSAATRYRSGGEDRILVPAPWSPTRRELVEGGVRGLACVQEIAAVGPGQGERYLEALRRHWQPQLTRRGLALVGAWTTAMRDDEVIVTWCLPGFDAFTGYLAWRDADPAGRRWLERARTWRRSWRETLLVSSPWCVTHPTTAPPAPRRGAPRRRPASATPR